MLRIMGFAAALVASMAVGASAQSLNIGDDAPALALSKTVKGEKIEKLEPDQTYVVEFWATWCGPCKTSIPHLTELQHRYKDKGVKFLGVSVWERTPANVEPFVAKMGDKMDYTVALDEVPDGAKANQGKMAEGWMTASGSDGIPTAFIVRKGKVAWIGHPMQMDKPLEKATSPDFDIEVAKVEAREEKAAEKKSMEVMTKLQKLGGDAELKDQLAVYDEAIAADPKMEKRLGYPKYLFLNRADKAGASAYGNKLVDTTFADQAELLNAIAWFNVDPDGKIEKSARDLKLALKAARKAVDLTQEKNGAILDTLAVAAFESGDMKRGLELEEQAYKLMDGSNAEVKARIEQYRKAIEAKAKP